ncbi:MAG: response regulator [Candidatus Dadabacteria bacterium]
MTSTTTSTILYVDDDRDDCMFFSQSFSEVNNTASVICANDGDEAVQYLSTVVNSTSTLLPSLIVMDLNMPRWDGKKTLKYLKSDPVLASIPVVILSTSNNKSEQDTCEKLGAARYYVKPFHFSELKNIVQQFQVYLQAS